MTPAMRAVANKVAQCHGRAKSNEAFLRNVFGLAEALETHSGDGVADEVIDLSDPEAPEMATVAVVSRQTETTVHVIQALSDETGEPEGVDVQHVYLDVADVQKLLTKILGQ